MRIRLLLIAAFSAALVLGSAPASFAQRARGMQGGTIKSADSGAKSFVVTVRRMQQQVEITVKTDDQTRFMKGGEAANFAEIKEGRFAAFGGEGTPDTGITAREVIILEKPGSVQQGEVKAVDAGTKSVTISVRRGGQARDVSIKLTDKTKVFKGREVGKFEDITAGARVIIVGEGNLRENTFAPVVIRVVPAPGGGQ